MSFSITNNQANSTGKNPTVKPLFNGNRRGAQRISEPSNNAPNAMIQDHVRFGGGNSHKSGTTTPTDSTNPVKDTPATDSEKPTEDQKKNSTEPKPKGAYGHHENNIREAARIVLCDIAPLALSVLPLMGIPGIGFVFALATLPMSYASGHLGRRIAKNVDKNDLNPLFKYIHQVKKAISDKKGAHQGNVVDAINSATDDLLNVRNMPAIVSTTLLPLLKVNPQGWAAKILTKMNGVAVMRSEVNIRLAQAENGKDAGKAVFTGVKDFALYSGMNKLGSVMETSSVPGAKWAGAFLKNAALFKIAADLLKTKEAKSAKPQGAS